MVPVKREPDSSAKGPSPEVWAASLDSFQWTMPGILSHPALLGNSNHLQTSPMSHAAAVIVKQEEIVTPTPSYVTTAGGGGSAASSSGQAVHNNSSGVGVGATAAPDIQTLPVGPAVLPATGGGRAAQAPRGNSMAIRSMQERQEYIQRQQRWLLFLRHCAKCQLDATECQFGCSCRVGRELWTHILQCSDPACNFSRCTSSKDLLKHHQKCQGLNCPICVCRTRNQRLGVPSPPVNQPYTA